MDLQQTLQDAESRLAAGDSETALDVLRDAMVRHPRDPDVLDALGAVHLKRGEAAAALRLLTEAARLGGGTIDRALNLAEAQLLVGQFQGAADNFQAVIKNQENNARAWFGLGQCLVATGDVERATGCFEAAVHHQADYAEAKLKLAACYLNRGFAQSALPLFREALRAFGQRPDILLDYAGALLETGNDSEAEKYARQLLDHPQYGEHACCILVMALLDSGAAEEALSHIEHLLALKPEDSRYAAWRGRALNVLGRREEAAAWLEDVVKRFPEYGLAWEYLVGLRPDGLSDSELVYLERLAEQGESGVAKELPSLYFTLARHYEKRRDYVSEFGWLEKGNAYRNRSLHYDPERGHASRKKSEKQFKRQRIEQLSRCGDENFRPVFFLCMPRSGSTLLEQILSSHSRVQGAGENRALSRALVNVQNRRGISTDLEMMDELDEGIISDLAQEFVSSLEEQGFSRDFLVTEKSANNFRRAGLLAAMFPNAVFIELRRHPLDVGLGCFRQNFSTQGFSFSLEGCAHQYADFDALTRFWRRELPNPPLVVHYEDLVNDLEGQVRVILEHCGLAWEDACLEYQKNTRQIATVSMNQVREGLFTAGMGRWRRYERQLEPLRRELEKLGVEIPE